MIKYFLKLDYSVSQWMGKNNQETAINGTVHLFLTKIWFISQSLFFLILPLFSFTLSAERSTILIALIIAIIMYGGKKPTKKLITRYNLPNEYKKCSKEVRVQRNSLALILLVVLFITMCLIGVFSFSGYSLR